MISGLGQKLGTDSVPTHDLRDPETWDSVEDSSWTLAPQPGTAIVMRTIRVLISNNAYLHSPLHIIYKDIDGNVLRTTVYESLDDFLDRFTEYNEISPSRYDHPIEEHIYEFPQAIVLRSARSSGTPNWYSLTIKIEDDEPYEAMDKNGYPEELEFCRVRFPDATWYEDTEYVPE